MIRSMFEPIVAFQMVNKKNINLERVNLHIKNDAKKFSAFRYFGAQAAGYCNFKCDSITENKKLIEGNDGFKKFPDTHTKWCVRACQFFELFTTKQAKEFVTNLIVEPETNKIEKRFD